MMSFQCPRCGASNGETAMGCHACGHSFVLSAAAASSWQPSPAEALLQPKLEEPPAAQRALIYAIIGFFCIGVLGAFAIAKGFEAKRMIALRPGTPGGTKAQFAIVLGAIDILLFALWMGWFVLRVKTSHR